MPKKKEKPMGRPSLYKPEYCEQLIDLLAKGFTITQLAGELRINPDTVYQWAKDYPKFSEAKAIGEALREKFYIQMGQSMSVGKVRGNPGAYVHLTRNVMKTWKDQKTVEITGANGGPIKYANLSEDELKSRIKEVTETLDDE